MKRSNYKAYDVDLAPFASSMIDEIKGKLSAVILGYFTGGVYVVLKAGSIVEVNGILYVFNSDYQLTVSSGIYLAVVYITSAGQLQVVENPTGFGVYDPVKKGWYLNNDRAIALMNISAGPHPYIQYTCVIQYLRYADQKI